MYECYHSAPYLEVDIECDAVAKGQIRVYETAEGFPKGKNCPPEQDTIYIKYIMGLCPDCVANDEQHRSWEKNGGTQETRWDEEKCGSAQSAGSIPNDTCCEQGTRGGDDEVPNDEQQQLVGENEPGTVWKYLGSTGSYT